MTETPIYDRLAFELLYDREEKLEWLEAVADLAAALPPPNASVLFPFLQKPRDSYISLPLSPETPCKCGHLLFFHLNTGISDYCPHCPDCVEFRSA